MMLNEAKMIMSFADLLRDSLSAQGFAGPGAQARFRKYLEDRYGVEVTDSTVSAWTTGARVPGTSNLVAILDALVVPEVDRSSWLTACAAHGVTVRSNDDAA